MILYQTQTTRRFSPTLTKFDSKLTLKGTKNLYFDPTIKTGWGQCHCKYYRIPFPTNIHGSKLELKRLKYLENHAKRVSMLPEAITFDLTIEVPISSIFWKLDIQTISGTLRSSQSKSGKTFKYAIKAKTGKGQDCWHQQLTRCTIKGRRS